MDLRHKKEIMKKKYDGFAIASFVMALITILFPLLIFQLSYNNMIKFSFYVFPLLSIIFGIASLLKIKKNKNLNGKFLSILGMIISIIVALIYTSLIQEVCGNCG